MKYRSYIYIIALMFFYGNTISGFGLLFGAFAFLLYIGLIFP